MQVCLLGPPETLAREMKLVFSLPVPCPVLDPRLLVKAVQSGFLLFGQGFLLLGPSPLIVCWLKKNRAVIFEQRYLKVPEPAAKVYQAGVADFFKTIKPKAAGNVRVAVVQHRVSKLLQSCI